jgi:hypothetical protein
VGCQGDGGRVDGRGYASTELSSLPALMFLDLGCCCHEVTAACRLSAAPHPKPAHRVLRVAPPLVALSGLARVTCV